MGCGRCGILRDGDLRAALVELFDDPVGVVSLVAKQGIEFDAFDERGHADGIVAVAQGIAKGEYLGRPTALGLAYGLILSPPFAPWP